MKSKTAEDKSQLDMFECNTNPAVSDQEPPANDNSERNPTGSEPPEPPEPPTPAPPSTPAANDDAEDKLPPGKVWVYTPYITVKGKRIFHPTGGVFRFPGDPDYNRDD